MIGKVGRKALRIYHEEGLLVPAFINEENGYHYYEESQLETLERIRRLRKIGLSLYEIKQVLEGNASEDELIGSKIRELDNKLQEAKELAYTSDSTTKEDTYEPDIRPFESCTCLYIEENIELENLGMSVGKLYEKASREGRAVTGDHFVIYECISKSDELYMKTCLPVKERTETDTITVSEEKCLHITFKEGFSKVARAHTFLKEYADSHGITLGGRVYEVYKKDMTVEVYYQI